MAYRRSSGLAQRRLWIIMSYRNNRMEILTTTQGGERELSLPLFSFKEEAEVFLNLFEGDHKQDWQIRETSPGELLSMLMAPSCASTRQVVLDPLPFSCNGVMLPPMLSVSRERFMQGLMREDRGVIKEELVVG